MENKNRRKKRQSRNDRIGSRIPYMGYYLVFTDTEETEENYIKGLRDSLPEEIKDKLIIKVFSNIKTEKMITACQAELNKHLQLRKAWLIFDKDRVVEFDNIIKRAKRYDINTGWSNPCIEIWFNAYFGSMPMCCDSVKCNENLKKAYKRATRKEYQKKEKKIYDILCKNGNEEKAIKFAEKRYNFYKKEQKAKSPTKMLSCSTLFELIKEIAQYKEIK